MKGHGHKRIKRENLIFEEDLTCDEVVESDASEICESDCKGLDMNLLGSLSARARQ